MYDVFEGSSTGGPWAQSGLPNRPTQPMAGLQNDED